MNLKSYVFSMLFSLLMFFIQNGYSQTGREGYYKDMFMDGGAELTHTTNYYAANALGLSYEFLASNDLSKLQGLMVTSANDSNGVLLYPDGRPRFRGIYVNGGLATGHGNALGETGRQRIRDFYYNGGSYTGSCAGAFITSLGVSLTGNASYFHIVPNYTKTIDVPYTPILYGAKIEPGSPLLNYYDFGGDHYIAEIKTWYGAYPNYEGDPDIAKWPPNTEILLRYDSPGRLHDNRPPCWAYKTNNRSGRVVVIGNHPEYHSTGERLELMQAILLYALDGTGDPQLKAELTNGVPRKMDNNDVVGYEKIGDKQYHHFMVNLPQGTSNLAITLGGKNDYNLSLYVNSERFAFNSNARYKMTGSGTNKVLKIGALAPGHYYISVECTSTVTVKKNSWGYSYTGNTGVLNGVSYTIGATWNNPE